MKNTFKQDTYKDSIKHIGLSIGNLASKLIEDTASAVNGQRNALKRAYLAYKGKDTKIIRTITITRDN